MEEQHKLLELIERSEARIDRTNDMIVRLSNVSEQMIREYSHHLDGLSNSRDKLQQLCLELMELHKRDQDIITGLHKDLAACQARTFKLIESLALRGGVTIENNFDDR